MARKKMSHRFTRAAEEVRASIEVDKILDRFQKCAEGKLQLAPDEIKCGEILLRKVMPDLKAVEHSGSIGPKSLREMTDAELYALLESEGERPERAALPSAGEGESADLHGVHDPEVGSRKDPSRH
jgi:hypothetical protein